MIKQVLFLTIAIFLLPARGLSQFTITVESGLVIPQYNDVRAPNQTGMKGSFFSLVDDFQETSNPAYLRAEAMYLISSKHTLEITAAPLVVESGRFTSKTLVFENQAFEGENIKGRYQFNTYRLSYRYRIVNRTKFVADIGATILMRDAAITISQNGTRADNTDLGFVPLISLYLKYNVSTQFETILKGDALVGPQGRAEDFFLGMQYAPYSKLKLKAGYRLLEGGADVNQVYNFAFFHFASLGFAYSF